jgi:hypothetical protein
MAKKTLQQQGVPFPSGLKGVRVGPPPKAPMRQATGPRATRKTVRDRTPLDGRMGGTRDTTTYYEYPAEESGRSSSRRNIRVRDLNPASAGTSAGSGIGGLEAEFLFAIFLLVLLMFANSSETYGNRIMSMMKRGALTCLLFFILALVAATGPNMAKIAKGFGALIIIMLLVTAPMNTVLTDVDNLIKNDWVATSENAGTASTGTGSSTSPNTSNLGQDFLTALENEVKKQGQKGGTGVTTAVKNALDATLNGIIPGAGSLLSKLGF